MVIGLLDLASVALLLWIACDLLQIADSKSNINPVKYRTELRLLALAALGFSLSAAVGRMGLETGIPTWLGMGTALFVVSLFFHALYSNARKASLMVCAILLIAVNLIRWL